jgi:N-acetyl-alpha-D-muramate 1-phosphate uridylyltransferase
LEALRWWPIPEPLLPVAILAGGLATRLRPLTEKVPKSLIEIHGEPFLAYQLRLLRSHGAERVVLCVGYRGEMIRDAIGDGRRFGLRVEYAFDGPALLGTAGAVRNALPQLGESFFVMYGDSYLPCDFAAVARAFSSSGKLALMTVFRNNGLWDHSNVEFEGGHILAYSKEKLTSRMHYIDYGLGVFRAEAFRLSGAADLAKLYGDLLQTGQLAALEVQERFYEIGSPAGLKETSHFLASGGVVHK